MNKAFSALAFLLPTFSFSQSGTTVFNDTVLHEIRIQPPYSAWFDTLQADYQLNLTEEKDALPNKYQE